jgi:hypothetical protein
MGQRRREGREGMVVEGGFAAFAVARSPALLRIEQGTPL